MREYFGELTVLISGLILLWTVWFMSYPERDGDKPISPTNFRYTDVLKED